MIMHASNYPSSIYGYAAGNAALAGDDRVTHTNITIRVPHDYHQEPIISKLVSEHGLIVNITAALLGEDAKEDGWFSLELKGTMPQIRSAMVYLEDLDLEVWEKNGNEEEDW
jgi:hypothetical protein